MPEAIKKEKEKAFASIVKDPDTDKYTLKKSSGDKNRDKKNQEFLDELVRYYAEMYGTGDLELDKQKIRDMMNLFAYQESLYDPSNMSAYNPYGILNERNLTRAKGKYHFKDDEVDTGIQRMHNNASSIINIYSDFGYIDQNMEAGNRLQMPFLNDLKSHKDMNKLSETEQDIFLLVNLIQGDAPFSKFMTNEISIKDLYFQGHYKGSASPEVVTNFDIRAADFLEKNKRGDFKLVENIIETPEEIEDPTIKSSLPNFFEKQDNTLNIKTE